MVITCKCKEARIAKILLKRKDKVGGVIPPDLKTFSKATVIKAKLYWYNRHNGRATGYKSRPTYKQSVDF
jgi:hypothetical protein